MADDFWYSPIDCIPKLKVKVNVLYHGTKIEAMRWTRTMKKSRRKVIVWATMNKKKVVFLRDDPAAWQPLYPDLYQGPLVNPFKLDEPPRIPPPVEPKREREWWREGGSIRYSLPGSVTPKEAEGRVMRALWAETSFERADTIYAPTPLSWLAKMIEIAEMVAGLRASYWHDRFTPSSRDLSDFTNIIVWLRSISDEHYTVLRMRAEHPPFTFEEIGREFGVSATTACKTYRSAILNIVRAANGFPVPVTTHAARRARDKKAGVTSYAAAN